MAEPVTVKLKKPLTVGDETITELTFRPMNGRLAKQVKTDTDHAFGMLLAVTEASCGVTAAVTNQLEGDDLDEVLAVAQDFTPGGRRIGAGR